MTKISRLFKSPLIPFENYKQLFQYIINLRIHMQNLFEAILLFNLGVFVLTCQGGCGEKGLCISEKCICDDGWFGSNCNINANELQAGVIATKNISAENWSYFYYPLKGKDILHEEDLLINSGVNKETDIQILIQADFTHLEIYSLFEEEDSFGLPSVQFNKSYSFQNSSPTETIYFSKKEIQSISNGKLVLGFRNSAQRNNNVFVQLSFVDSKNSNVAAKKKTVIIIGVAIAVFVASIRIMFDLCNKIKNDLKLID